MELFVPIIIAVGLFAFIEKFFSRQAGWVWFGINALVFVLAGSWVSLAITLFIGFWEARDYPAE